MKYLRRVAATSALALAASGLGAVASTPASAADGATFTWAFSDYLFNAGQQPVGFTSNAVSGGATKSPAGIDFAGTATGSLETGDLQIATTGSVTFTWHVDLTFSDPEVVVEGDEGRIVADVAWKLPETGSADDVVLTTFDPSSAIVDGGRLTATPDWSTGSWAPEFLAAVPSSVHGFFKASGSSSDARKAPSAFTVATGTSGVSPAVGLATRYAQGRVEIDFSGTGFTAVTEPGDQGVYAVLAPAGRFPETDDFEDQKKVAVAEWITPAQLADGSFEVTLAPANRHLDPRKKYAVYTWQAHTHSNPSQDTTSPVDIDFSKIGKATKLKAARSGKQLVVTVGKSAAGKVAVKLTKGKATKKASAKVVSKTGKARIKLPAAAGTWKAQVTFAPTKATYRAATKTFTVRVR